MFQMVAPNLARCLRTPCINQGKVWVFSADFSRFVSRTLQPRNHLGHGRQRQRAGAGPGIRLHADDRARPRRRHCQPRGAGASSCKTWCMAAPARCRRPSPFAGRPLRPGPLAQRHRAAAAGALPGVWHAGGAPPVLSPAGCRRGRSPAFSGRPAQGAAAAQRPAAATRPTRCCCCSKNSSAGWGNKPCRQVPWPPQRRRRCCSGRRMVQARQICSCGSSGGWQCLAGLCLDTVPRAVAMACVPQRHKAPGCGRGLFSSCARPCTSRAGAAAAWPLRRAGPWPRPRARA
jgi:hypothetical protein